MKNLLCILALGLAISSGALLVGQIPVDTNVVLTEAGREVGEVYRGPGFDDASVYVEHWILYPGYVYPGPRTLTVLNLTPKAETPYRNEAGFFANAAFPKGSKYVRVLAEEFNQLPAVQR